MAQAMLDFDPCPADRDTGFELGWDYAHYALAPPLEHLAAASPLLQGLNAGRAGFGARTLAPTRHVRKWLQLRLSSWRRGRVFEGVQVTPNYLRQIDIERCPITRETLTHGSGGPSDASVDRVRNDGGYAAGNLAAMSARANAAKSECGFDDALALMRLAEAGNTTAPELDGLGAAEWARIAVLCSFVTALPHEQAAGLPLLVLPPNRLRLFNPIQALQALATRQIGEPGWCQRITRLEALLPGKPLRRDFRLFVFALLPRLIEAGRHLDEPARTWALEDAWRNPLVLRSWTRFARQLDAPASERIVQRAAALRLVSGTVQPFDDLDQATEGWALETAGYVTPPTGPRHKPPRVALVAAAPRALARQGSLQLALPVR